MSAAKKKKSNKKNKSNKKINKQNNINNSIIKEEKLDKTENGKVINQDNNEGINNLNEKDLNKKDSMKEGLNKQSEKNEISAKENIESNLDKSEEKSVDEETDKVISDIKNETQSNKDEANEKTAEENKPKENENNNKKELVKAPKKDIASTDEKPEYVQEMIKKRKRKKFIFITIVILVLFIIMFSTFFAIFNLKNINIISSVSIKTIDVSNLSKEEAKNRINEATNKELIAELELKYGEEYSVTLKPEQIEFKYEIDDAIENAYKVGRDGSIIENNYSIIYTKLFGKDIKLSYTYNGDLLNQFIEDINSKLPGVVVSPTYYIENNQLIINKGTDGIQVKKEELKNQIIQGIIQRDAKEMTEGYKQKMEIPVENVMAPEIDMDKIYSEVHTEPQDAYYETDPYKIYPDVDGVDLAITLDEAKNSISSEDKEEYIFNLKITGAEKTIDDLGTEAFPYLISSFTTKYDASNRNRSTNLEIAAKKINGKVLMPGEEFSFNKVVGKRTVEEGYKDAKIYADGGVVDGLAGGICQISSTLYNAVLLANLQVTERRNHTYTTSYVPAGKDATVVWGTTDFRFINTRSYPIKLEATVSNGIAEFKIHGMQEEVEYEVRILPVRTQSIPYTTTYQEDATLLPGQQVVEQSGHAGYKVTTYKELRLNGEVVSKEAISSDTYSPMRTIVRVGSGGVPVQ